MKVKESESQAPDYECQACHGEGAREGYGGCSRCDDTGMEPTERNAQ